MNEPPPKSKRQYRLGMPLSSAVGCMLPTLIALIALAMGWAFFRITRLPERMMTKTRTELEAVGRDLRSVFIDIAHLQPRITINNRVYLEQTTPTSELAILSRRIEVEHELQHTWAGSSKRVRLHGTFAVKAGFDLRQNLSVDVRPDEIIVQLPHAQILGVEQEQLEVLAFENGFWNRISAADVQAELTVLPQLAREKIAESNLTTEAERALQQQLDARIHARQPLRLVFTSTSKKE